MPRKLGNSARISSHTTPAYEPALCPRISRPTPTCSNLLASIIVRFGGRQIPVANSCLVHNGRKWYQIDGDVSTTLMFISEPLESLVDRMRPSKCTHLAIVQEFLLKNCMLTKQSTQIYGSSATPATPLVVTTSIRPLKNLPSSGPPSPWHCPRICERTSHEMDQSSMQPGYVSKMNHEGAKYWLTSLPYGKIISTISKRWCCLDLAEGLPVTPPWAPGGSPGLGVTIFEESGKPQARGWYICTWHFRYLPVQQAPLFCLVAVLPWLQLQGPRCFAKKHAESTSTKSIRW